MGTLWIAMKKIFRRVSYTILLASLFALFAFLDYMLLTRTTSWQQFLTDNSGLFIFLTLFLGTLNNILIALALTFFIYVIEEKKKVAKGTVSNSVIGIVLSLVSVGCAVCAGFLLPILGIAASLTAFPFQGLEIKVLSIILLVFSLRELSLLINGRLKELTKGVGKYIYGLGLLFVLLLYLIPRLPYQFKSIFRSSFSKETVSSKERGNIFDEINPVKGYEINAAYGVMGPTLIKMGVLDFDKYKSIYEKSGSSLTQEQFGILTQGSDKKIRIDRDNSYFLLDFFWAVGLANNSKILTHGDITKYGQNQVGNFASTGGWSLAKGDPMNYYAKSDLIPLTGEEEDLVQRVASHIYRPCCGNSTAFPDCNHGMALLGVLELMASNGASENQMYEAAKYFNAFWFPSNYYDIALYFKNKEGKSFSQMPGQVVLSKDVSSAQGAQMVKQWLIEKGVEQAPPKQGGGCGV